MGRTSADGPSRSILADLVLRPDASEVARSRHVVGAVLQRQGCEGAQDYTELIVSELVTNAVEFAQHEVRVTVARDDTCIRIEVHDDGLGDPESASHPLLAEAGRGLGLVESLTTQWGVEPDAEGKTVWGEVHCPPDAAPASEPVGDRPLNSSS